MAIFPEISEPQFKRMLVKTFHKLPNQQETEIIFDEDKWRKDVDLQNCLFSVDIDFFTFIDETKRTVTKNQFVFYL